MALDVFFHNDIERILAALASSGGSRGPEYLAALEHVALAFGVQPQPVNAWEVVEPDKRVHYVPVNRLSGG